MDGLACQSVSLKIYKHSTRTDWGRIQFIFALYNFHLFSEIFISIDEYAI